MTGRRAVLAGLGAGALLGLACGPLAAQEGSPTPPAETTPPVEPPPDFLPVVFPLEAGDVTVIAELARTDAERARGLGGHAPLGETDGMLFVFDRSATHAFWMKGMTFPLDIMWIDGGRVVHLERDLPPSPPTETDATRPVVAPRQPARFVLEVNAGFAAAYGIEVGSPVVIAGA